MKVVGRSAASKSGRVSRFSASMAASILAHGAALALAALLAPPRLDPEAGRPALVVSLAERKNLGAVSAPGPAASKRLVSKTAPRPRESAAADKPGSATVAPTASPALAAGAPAAERPAAIEAAPVPEGVPAAAPSERLASQAALTGLIPAGGQADDASGSAGEEATRTGWSPATSAGAAAIGRLGPEEAAEAASADYKKAFADRLTYPESARRAGKTGAVGLLIRIDEDGRVAWARVRSSSGSSALDRAALEAAKSIERVTPPLAPLSLTIRAVFEPAAP